MGNVVAPQPQPDLAKWAGPPLEKLKCNINVAFMNNKVGISICLSDHHENFIKAKTTRYAPVLFVKEGEAYGLLQAIKMDFKVGFE
jgi:hypothetical protein